ncbi:MAG: hypothetical protein WDW36_006437 [Sanguina aurantia]
MSDEDKRRFLQLGIQELDAAQVEAAWQAIPLQQRQNLDGMLKKSAPMKPAQTPPPPAQSSPPRQTTYPKVYTDMLQQLSPSDAVIMHTLYGNPDSGSSFGPMSNADIESALARLDPAQQLRIPELFERVSRVHAGMAVAESEQNVRKLSRREQMQDRIQQEELRRNRFHRARLRRISGQRAAREGRPGEGWIGDDDSAAASDSDDDEVEEQGANRGDASGAVGRDDTEGDSRAAEAQSSRGSGGVSGVAAAGGGGQRWIGGLILNGKRGSSGGQTAAQQEHPLDGTGGPLSWHEKALRGVL